MEEQLLTTSDVATLLKVSQQTIYRWRNANQGPPFLQLEGSIRYRRADVQAWKDERTLGGTLPV